MIQFTLKTFLQTLWYGEKEYEWTNNWPGGKPYWYFGFTYYDGYRVAIHIYKFYFGAWL